MNTSRIDVKLSLSSHIDSTTRVGTQTDEDFIAAVGEACVVTNLDVATCTVDGVAVTVLREGMDDSEFKSEIAAAIRGAVGI